MITSVALTSSSLEEFKTLNTTECFPIGKSYFQQSSCLRPVKLAGSWSDSVNFPSTYSPQLKTKSEWLSHLDASPFKTKPVPSKSKWICVLSSDHFTGILILGYNPAKLFSN